MNEKLVLDLLVGEVERHGHLAECGQVPGVVSSEVARRMANSVVDRRVVNSIVVSSVVASSVVARRVFTVQYCSGQ